MIGYKIEPVSECTLDSSKTETACPMTVVFGSSLESAGHGKLIDCTFGHWNRTSIRSVKNENRGLLALGAANLSSEAQLASSLRMNIGRIRFAKIWHGDGMG